MAARESTSSPSFPFPKPLIKQRTLKNKVRATGVGVHLGQRVEMHIRPAPPDTGIVFRRTDLPGTPAVKAHALNVNDTRMSTRIEDARSGSCRRSPVWGWTMPTWTSTTRKYRSWTAAPRRSFI
jgi:hypothetical protein